MSTGQMLPGFTVNAKFGHCISLQMWIDNVLAISSLKPRGPCASNVLQLCCCSSFQWLKETTSWLSNHQLQKEHYTGFIYCPERDNWGGRQMSAPHHLTLNTKSVLCSVSLSSLKMPQHVISNLWFSPAAYKKVSSGNPRRLLYTLFSTSICLWHRNLVFRNH